MIVDYLRGGTATRAAAIAAVVAALTSGGAAHADNNKGMETVPLTITNKSGLPGAWYVFVTGSDANGTYWYVTDASGDVSAFPGGTAPYKQYGMAFTKAQSTTLNVPKLSNTRIYVSYDRKMWMQPSAGVPSTPAGWESTDKNYATLFDWAEYTWTDVAQPSNFQTSLNGNLTQVDMLGLPMLLEFAGQNANQKNVVTAAGFSNPKSRPQIFAALAAAGTPWSRLAIIPGRGGLPLRAIAPYHGMAVGVFPKNQLAGYINQVFSNYASKTMVANTNADGVNATFNAKVAGNKLTFTQKGASANAFTFAKPTSNQAYSGYPPTYPAGASGTLQAQGAQVGTMVQAAFMRGTMITEPTISDCPGTSAYYVNDPINMYSKIMHLYAYQHKAYGFGYDDVCNQSSDFTVFDPTGIELTIQPVSSPKVKPTHKHKKKHWKKKHRNRHGKRHGKRHHRR